jgi:hypothetical protein
MALKASLSPDGSRRAHRQTAGTLTLGDLEVRRLGYGAMRITGPGSIEHLEEDVAAAALQLSDGEFSALNAAA